MPWTIPENWTSAGTESAINLNQPPQCAGVKPNGEQCKKPPVKGGTHCYAHGGKPTYPNGEYTYWKDKS